jgi:type II secretory pathway component GspD/PulD (secretin)
MCNPKRGIKILLNIALLLFLSLLSAPDTFGGEAERSPKGKAAAKADFVITIKNNLISLEAKDASLKEVLEEIGRKMKIDVVAGIPYTKKITAEFENLSIEEAVNRLSTNYSYVMDSANGERKITKIIVLQKGTETALSMPATKESTIKKEERLVKPESKAKEDVIGKGSNESAIKKEERLLKPETSVRQEAIKKESPPPPKPFGFQFDPSQYGQKRR